MPRSPEHHAKYSRNRAFLNTGLAAVNPEWAAVVAFYAAVHLVERLAAVEPRGPRHHRTHADRVDYLARHPQHSVLLADYQVLQVASEISRYGTVHQFHSRYGGGVVQDQLIDVHLAAIEQYVAAHFAPPPPPGPPPAAPTAPPPPAGP
jgi:hypothetical protein